MTVRVFGNQIAGATGIADSNVQLDEIMTRYHALYWGADPTGTNDSTASIQQAIDVAHADGGGTVQLGVGTYLTRTLVLKNGVSLQGEGQQSSTLRAAANIVGPVISIPNTAIERIRLANFSVNGNRDNALNGTFGIGAVGGALFEISAEAVSVSDCRSDGININSAATQWPFVYLRDCYFGWNTGSGALLTNGSLNIGNVLCDENGVDGLAIVNGDSVQIIDSRFTTSQRHGIRLTGTLGFQIVGCTAYMNNKQDIGAAGLFLETSHVGSITGCQLGHWDIEMQAHGIYAGANVSSVTLAGNTYAGNTVSSSTLGNNRITDLDAMARQFVCLSANYTTVSGPTALQRLFNATGSGAITLPANSSWRFRCSFELSLMSATSGTFSFGFLGTAAISQIKYTASSIKAFSGPNAPTVVRSSTVAATTPLVAANTITAGQADIEGVIRVTTGGTLIPAFAVSVAAPVVVVRNSYLEIGRLGSDTVTTHGDWS